AGKLTDRRRPALVLGLSMAAFAGAFALFALAPDRGVLLVAVAFAGVAYGGVNPPTNVMVAGRLGGRGGFFLGAQQSVGALGVVLPSVALAHGWRVSVGLAAVVCALAALAVVLVRNARRIVLTASGQGKDPGRREIAALGMFGFVMAGTQWAFLTYLVLFLTE